MFLKQLEKLNPELIQYAFKLHQTGQILPDTYVIDLDMIRQNTSYMVAEAKKNHVELLYMTKQVGRNPVIAKEVVNAGIPEAVVVDFREAETFMENGLALGNVGHLVQPPKHFLKRLLKYGTKYVTMYSLENAQKLNEVASAVGIKQKVLLKVVGNGDDIYPGQTGGFTLAELDKQLDQLKTLSNIKLVGITTFPAILYDESKQDFLATANLKTIDRAKNIFNKHHLKTQVVSLPSATSTTSIPLIKQLGGNEGEPGHALTGTTPLHAVKDQPEKPAYCYVSEVSHTFGSHSYVFGGGWYRRGHLKNALVQDGEYYVHAHVLPLENSNIDYYLELDQQFKSGLPVVMAFRTQIFVTRSTVALVRGLQTAGATPELVGLYDSQGKKLPGRMQ
ncbi:amino acid racemase [Lacticaseibacillus zeae DSM 20178 = KCTC 3804]|uniref:Amino acid racemase n=1 Tax=Lacticaseibacillus zeae DSM 20178 = KCTC 3804 TaxID=1423816 RepID=A0A0R1ETG0_LACZE|nr:MULTISPECIES: YhfX family PLP-dependent enzyme [Lacticaseibacillus]KLI74651.1 amino acid racemase [Lacticaseibacillus casei]KRK12479.1 amino acid racemase [Lacticaseibacillus zeae DSM 20178 = KCTC 3804]OLS06284.1 amino-acid racemase [Lacticaseibacillus casei]QVI32405.1 YhfX family PLP-dependent enzyme [Lacticaseibacillus zeae]